MSSLIVRNFSLKSEALWIREFVGPKLAGPGLGVSIYIMCSELRYNLGAACIHLNLLLLFRQLSGI